MLMGSVIELTLFSKFMHCDTKILFSSTSLQKILKEMFSSTFTQTTMHSPSISQCMILKSATFGVLSNKNPEGNDFRREFVIEILCRKNGVIHKRWIFHSFLAFILQTHSIGAS
uniref:Uncharacterized protein n=1 Tax=Lepeophtheirus salmonis TaxID=72036 RepID=A0A0K2UHE1_LEPSM